MLTNVIRICLTDINGTKQPTVIHIAPHFVGMRESLKVAHYSFVISIGD